MWQMFEACWPWSHYSVTVANLVGDKQRLEESLKSAQERIKTLLDLLDSGATILAEKKKVIATIEATMRDLTATNVDLSAQIEAKDHQLDALMDWQTTLRKKAEIGRRMFVQKSLRQKDAAMGMIDEMDLMIEAIHKEDKE
jgi:paraquat-inducible protein B